MAKEKILLTYLKTGGGHLAPAKSLASYINLHYGHKAETILADGFEETNPLVRSIIIDGYRILQARARWMYSLLYLSCKLDFLARLNINMLSFFAKPYLRSLILREMPSRIVIFHFFLIKPVYDILEEQGLNIPVSTVVTDPYTAHPIWFVKKNQDFIIFSDELKQKILKKGVTEKSIRIFPFILDEKFSSAEIPERDDAFRKSKGLPFNKKTILIMGGGDGIPKGKKILREILDARLDASVVIVCGKNRALFKNAMKLKRAFGSDNLFVFEYVDFVFDLVRASDLVVTKCGASTFMEILLLKKIPVVNDYIWEQEKGNVEFLCKNRLGIFERKISKLPAIIKKLLDDQEFYSGMRNNIIGQGLQNGVGDVADYLLSFRSEI